MLRFQLRPCTSSCCDRSLETNASASVRSSASSRSAWSTSPRRSRARGHRVTHRRPAVQRAARAAAAAHAPGSRRHRRHARARDRRGPRARARGPARSRRTCRSSSAATPRRRIPEPFLVRPTSTPSCSTMASGRCRRSCDALERGASARRRARVWRLPTSDGGVMRTAANAGRLRPRRRAAAGAASRRWLAASVRLPGASSRPG